MPLFNYNFTTTIVVFRDSKLKSARPLSFSFLEFDVYKHKHNPWTPGKSTLNWTGELPDYRTYKKSWWEEHFDNGVHLVSIKHVTTQHYARRTERYVVYIEKNACLPKEKK